MSRVLFASALCYGIIPSLGCVPGAPSSPPHAAPAAVDAPKSDPISLQWEVSLWEPYGGNEAAADEKYTGKTVELVARGRVRKDDGGYYIACNVAVPVPEGTPAGVVCRMSPDDERKLAAAKPDKDFPAFKVRGVCTGRKDNPTAYGGYTVTVTGCRLIAVMAWDGKRYKEVN